MKMHFSTQQPGQQCGKLIDTPQILPTFLLQQYVYVRFPRVLQIQFATQQQGNSQALHSASDLRRKLGTTSQHTWLLDQRIVAEVDVISETWRSFKLGAPAVCASISLQFGYTGTLVIIVYISSCIYCQLIICLTVCRSASLPVSGYLLACRTCMSKTYAAVDLPSRLHLPIRTCMHAQAHSLRTDGPTKSTRAHS